MAWLAEFVRRIGMLHHRRRAASEIDEEMQLHLDLLREQEIAAGVAPRNAGPQAQKQFGNLTLLREQSYDAWGWRWLESLLQDIRYSARILRKNPAFTLTAALSLALAIGANTTIFSVAKQLLYDQLDVPRAHELRLFSWIAEDQHNPIHSVWGDYDPLPGGRVSSTAFSYAAWQHWRAGSYGLANLFAFKEFGVNVTINGAAHRMRGEMVSGNYYSALELRPVLGRGIVPADDAGPGQGAVAVIGYGLWERTFARSPRVLGQVVQVNDVPLTIVGVNPRQFTSADDTLSPVDIFVPLAMQPLVSPRPRKVQPLFDRDLWWLNIMGRALPGIPNATAQAALNAQVAAIVRSTMNPKPGDRMPRIDLRDGSRGLFEQQIAYAKPMTVLLVLVGFVLLLACANVANLMLARGAQRHREMSVRLTLGAGRLRVLRQMLIESLLLSAIGGAIGLLAAWIGRSAIPAMLVNSWDQQNVAIRFDWRVFAFTAALSLLTGILFGLAPALAAARRDLNRGLKAAGQSTTRRRRGAGGRALIGFQIALCTLLVIAAGLFLRTFAKLRAVDPGFRTDHLLLFDIDPPETRYPAGKDIPLHQRFAEAFARIPGVASVTPAQVAYLSDSRSMRDFDTETVSNQLTRLESVYDNTVGADFFSTLRIPILAGRSFGPQDTAASHKVGIINQSLARARFRGQYPIGKRFRISVQQHDGSYGKEWIEIVGVCADTRYDTLRAQPPPQLFLPYMQQNHVGGMSYEVHTTVPLESIVPALRRVARQIDPTLPLSNVRTQTQQIEAAMRQERLFVTLTSGFGLLALALASVGVYGVLAYSVEQRRQEIGIRLALGAQQRQVRGMILRETLWITASGTTLGAASALALSRLVAAMLYRVRPDDPATVTAGLLVLICVALAAAWLPARRASRVDPMIALRAE